jgi:hypothetical protein
MTVMLRRHPQYKNKEAPGWVQPLPDHAMALVGLLEFHSPDPVVCGYMYLHAIRAGKSRLVGLHQVRLNGAST